MKFPKRTVGVIFCSMAALAYVEPAMRDFDGYYELGYSYTHQALRYDKRPPQDKCTLMEAASYRLWGASKGIQSFAVPLRIWGAGETNHGFLFMAWESAKHFGTLPASTAGWIMGVHHAFPEYCTNPDAEDPGTPQYYYEERPAPRPRGPNIGA